MQSDPKRTVELEHESTRARDGAIKAAYFQELFSGAVGHDLRNPLAAIMAAAEVMLTAEPSAKDVARLNHILDSGQRMARMLDQLLDFSRITSDGGMPSEPMAVDIGHIARDVLDETDRAYSASQIELATRGDLTGMWDPDRLAQLISNLVSNAVIHGAPDAPVRVDIDGADVNAVTVAISNQGVIPDDLVPALFEPFRRVRTKRARGAGLGLGLYIARAIANVYRGSIDAVTTDPRRTTFTVTLPR